MGAKCFVQCCLGVSTVDPGIGTVSKITSITCKYFAERDTEIAGSRYAKRLRGIFLPSCRGGGKLERIQHKSAKSN
jgi:hypothetical protein